MPESKGGGGEPTSAITEDDRRDLITLLHMRFGRISPDVMAAIQAINDFSQIDHLILVAANTPGWNDFIQELQLPGFRIVGQKFDPLPGGLPKRVRKEDTDGQ